MPAQFTLPPDTRATGTGSPAADMDAVIDALAAMGAGLNVLNAAFSGGADPTGASDSTAAINAALSAAPAGAAVYLPQGTYKTSAPLVIPTGVALRGALGNVLSLTDYGSVIVPSASFSGAAVITVTGEEQQVRDLTIDGTAAPSGTHGISGAASSVLLDRVAVDFAPGNAVNQLSGSQAWLMRAVTVHRAGLSGFVLISADFTAIGCYAIGCGQVTGSPGWSISTCSNSTLTGCRSEDSSGGAGFLVTSGNKAGNGLSFAGCSTQGNAKDGFSITNTAGNASPVNLSGCRANEDGVNGGSGGGGYGGYAFRLGTSGGNPAYAMSGCITVPGTQFSTGAPQYGLVVATASTAHIRATASLLWGVTAGVSSDASAAVLDTSLCTTGTGLPATPATFTG